MSGAIDLLGLFAGMLTTAAFVPQVVKATGRPSLACGPRLDPIGETWRTRSAGDLSGAMFLVFGVGVFLWLIYGVAIGSRPVMIANAVTFVLVLAVLFLKYRYR